MYFHNNITLCLIDSVYFINFIVVIKYKIKNTNYFTKHQPSRAIILNKPVFKQFRVSKAFKFLVINNI